jgi:hypothetical protein
LVRDGAFFDVEADFGLWRRWRRLKQWPGFLVDVAERPIVQEEAFINFGKAPQDGGIGREVLAHFDESADEIHAHSDGIRAVEDISRHQRAVFAEGERPGTGEFEPDKVVTICDHIPLFSIGQLEYKVRWEAVRVPFHRLVEGLVWHAVEGGQIVVQHDPRAADGTDEPGDVPGASNFSLILHGEMKTN